MVSAAMGGVVRRSSSALALVLLLLLSIPFARSAAINCEARQVDGKDVSLVDEPVSNTNSTALSVTQSTTTATISTTMTTTITTRTTSRTHTSTSRTSPSATISTSTSSTRSSSSSTRTSTSSTSPAIRQTSATQVQSLANLVNTVPAFTFTVPNNLQFPTTSTTSSIPLSTESSNPEVVSATSVPSKSLWNNKAAVAVIILIPTLIIVAGSVYLFLSWYRRKRALRHHRLEDQIFEKYVDEHQPQASRGHLSYTPSVSADPFQAPAIRVHPSSSPEPPLAQPTRSHYQDFGSRPADAYYSSSHRQDYGQGQFSSQEWLTPPPATTPPRKPGLRESFDSFLNSYSGKRSSYRI